MSDEVPLSGGNMGAVSRVGDRVLRPAGPWTPAVHRLLRTCREQGFGAVPQVFGVRDDGREEVSFITGDVPQYPLTAWVWGEAALVSSGALLRAFHEASRHCPTDGPWQQPVREPVEVVCHNDFAPYNLVFRDGVAVGVIDCDQASPGSRLWDFAYLAYRMVPLTLDRADGFTDEERVARLDRLVAVYGADWSRDEVLRMVVRRLDHLAEFSDRKAVELGRPELAEHAAVYRADREWIARSLRI